MPTMYDSETPSAIPPDAEIVAGYVDGQWPDFDELARTHPNAQRVSITVEGRPDTRVADLEVPNFNSATIQELAAKGAAWAKAEIEAGRRPTLYYSRGNASTIGNALSEAGVSFSQVDFWVADWNEPGTQPVPHLVNGSVATQYASPSTGSGGNFDLSETNGAWPGVSEQPAPEPAPEPVPAPSPSPTESEDANVVVEYQQGGQQHVIVRQPEKSRTVHYWQAVAGSAPVGAPADFYAWHSEVLPEPA